MTCAGISLVGGVLPHVDCALAVSEWLGFVGEEKCWRDLKPRITQDEARSGRIAEAELVAPAPFGLVESPVRLLQQVSRT